MKIRFNTALIPNEIKLLCLEFYYRFLKHNKYCSVYIPKNIKSSTLQVETSAMHSIDGKYQFGARLVSRIPLNSQEFKVRMWIMDTFTIPTVDNKDFVCTAIASYCSEVDDELDVVENEEYKIHQTSPSGWWYASDKDNNKGKFVHALLSVDG